MRTLLSLALCLIAGPVRGWTAPPVLDLIPGARQLQPLEGTFHLKPGLRVRAPRAFRDAGAMLRTRLGLEERPGPGAAAIVFLQKQDLEPEGYRLEIRPSGIRIEAATAQGARLAVSTLAQLRLLQPDPTRLPALALQDAPRFSYRGLHLDVSRHVYPVSFIKKLLDGMALYKFNTFHWHLTDGPGWRLEIKGHPELTRKGAFRTRRTFSEWWPERTFSEEGRPEAFGGYYTQAEAREVVAHAAQLGITVIPEIEVPGHSEAALAAYPHLSCDGKGRAGEFCIGNPGTLPFLMEVLEEVLAIFPAPRIHLGGDEAGTGHWQRCPRCQAMKRELGLEDERGLQAHLMRQLGDFLRGRGRTLVGWDEIIHGGLPSGAWVMNWRGPEFGLEALGKGHPVVMTPGTLYFDAYQGDPRLEPQAIGGYVPLEQVHAFEPMPEGLDPDQSRRVLGAQGCLWTEYMPTADQVEYMAFPRALALAERVWSPKERRDFPDFQRRLQAHYRLLQRLQVQYRRPTAQLDFSAGPGPDGLFRVGIRNEQYQPVIRYTTDGTEPGASSPRYEGPFPVSGRTLVQAACFREGIREGGVATFTAHAHKAIGRPVRYLAPWSAAYPAQGAGTLTNGTSGGFSYHDRQWQAFEKALEVVVDLGAAEPLTTAGVRFMHQPGPGIHLPPWVEVSLSVDGETFQPPIRVAAPDRSSLGPFALQTFEVPLGRVQARYLRLKAPNDRGGYLFADEVFVH